MHRLVLCSFVLIALLSAPGRALASNHDSRVTPPNNAADAELTAGEVRRVDKEQKKITLRHAEIRNLDMPAMSMVFNVRDPALLDKLAVGDKVRFRAEKIDGAYYVTRIEQ